MSDEPETVEYKGEVVGKVGGCQIIVVEDSKGKHFEATCQSKEARDKLASIFEQEAILRINPKVVLDDTPPVEQPPAAEAVNLELSGQVET